MTETEAAAEAFYSAFKALPKEERDAVLVRLARDRAVAQDLLDLALIEERRDEPSRPFREYLAEKDRG